MKHLLRGLFIAVLFICCNFQLVLAQPMQELPVDKTSASVNWTTGLPITFDTMHFLKTSRILHRTESRFHP